MDLQDALIIGEVILHDIEQRAAITQTEVATGNDEIDSNFVLSQVSDGLRTFLGRLRARELEVSLIKYPDPLCEAALILDRSKEIRMRFWIQQLTD